MTRTPEQALAELRDKALCGRWRNWAKGRIRAANEHKDKLNGPNGAWWRAWIEGVKRHARQVLILNSPPVKSPNPTVDNETWTLMEKMVKLKKNDPKAFWRAVRKLNERERNGTNKNDVRNQKQTT